MLVPPSRDAALPAGGAFIFDGAAGGEVVFEMLLGWAAIDVLPGQINKDLFADSALTPSHFTLVHSLKSYQTSFF